MHGVPQGKSPHRPQAPLGLPQWRLRLNPPHQQSRRQKPPARRPSGTRPGCTPCTPPRGQMGPHPLQFHPRCRRSLPPGQGYLRPSMLCGTRARSCPLLSRPREVESAIASSFPFGGRRAEAVVGEALGFRPDSAVDHADNSVALDARVSVGVFGESHEIPGSCGVKMIGKRRCTSQLIALLRSEVGCESVETSR
ncbi:zinc finger C-x8-C-x5-C-x3-H type family protein, partial [Striga asiatica]